MTREPREDLVLELLKANWNNGNTFSVTPKITFGWFRENVPQPQITVGQPTEDPVAGGETGYSHISGDGTPGQTINGVITVHVWSSPNKLSEQNAGTTNPRQYNERACEEIQRIITDNASKPTNPDTGNQPVSTLGYNGREPAPEPDRENVYHYIARVMYNYDG